MVFGWLQAPKVANGVDLSTPPQLVWLVAKQLLCNYNHVRALGVKGFGSLGITVAS